MSTYDPEYHRKYRASHKKYFKDYVQSSSLVNSLKPGSLYEIIKTV